jgi:hypothetical protein
MTINISPELENFLILKEVREGSTFELVKTSKVKLIALRFGCTKYVLLELKV